MHFLKFANPSKEMIKIKILYRSIKYLNPLNKYKCIVNQKYILVFQILRYLGSSFKRQNWQLAYLNIKPDIFLFLSYRWMSLFCRVECYNEKWIFKGLFPLPFDVIAIILLGLRHRATKMFRSLRWVRKTWVPKIGHY